MTTQRSIKELDPLLSSVLRVDADRLADEVTMDDLDGWDSLTHMTLITALESTFGIELDGDEIADMQSIGAVRRTLKQHGVR